MEKDFASPDNEAGAGDMRQIQPLFLAKLFQRAGHTFPDAVIMPYDKARRSRATQGIEAVLARIIIAVRTIDEKQRASRMVWGEIKSGRIAEFLPDFGPIRRVQVSVIQE